MTKELEEAKCTKNCHLIYSMWEGYLKEDRLSSLVTWIDQNNRPITFIHTSGHAPIPDLQRFANALSPKYLVPIHTEYGNKFCDYFDNVQMHADGEWKELIV